MKKSLSILIALIFCLSVLTACESKSSTGSENPPEKIEDLDSEKLPAEDTVIEIIGTVVKVGNEGKLKVVQDEIKIIE